MGGGVMSTDATADVTLPTAAPSAGGRTLSRGAPSFSAPRTADSLAQTSASSFEEQAGPTLRHTGSRSGRGTGGAGWTDPPGPRGHGGSFSSRGSEHSDREGGPPGAGGGSALAEALALRERERQRTMEERAAQDRALSKQMRSQHAADVSAVYDPPEVAAALTPKKGGKAPGGGRAPPPRYEDDDGDDYRGDADASEGKAGGSPAPATSGRGGHQHRVATDEHALAAAGGGQASSAPFSPSGGGGATAAGFASSSAAAAAAAAAVLASPAGASSGDPTGSGGGGDEDGPLMAVAPLMLPPGAAGSAAPLAAAGGAPLDLTDMRRFLTMPTPRAAGIVQVGLRA
jgi:hypothetical protein